MKKKRKAVFFLTAFISVCLSFPAFAGWKENSNGTWCYKLEDGSNLRDGFTEDGYYVDATGYWKSTYSIFFTDIPARNYFVNASRNKDWAESKGVLDSLKTAVSKKLSPIRGLKLGGELIEYVRLSNEKETLLYSFALDTENDGYVLKLQTALSRDTSGTATMAWYDYQVLRVLMASVSRTGDQIADAIYSSWEAKNSYGLKLNQWVRVGDCEIMYAAGNGAGYYYIRPAAGALS